VRVVVDANVLISGLLWHGAPNAPIEQARLDVINIVTSPLLPAEFEEVIRRRKFRAASLRSQTDPQRPSRDVRQLVEIVEAPLLRRQVSRDPDNDGVLAVAMVANVDLIASVSMDRAHPARS
jgi:putative PIN family toxin of toxin-antitoxin system